MILTADFTQNVRAGFSHFHEMHRKTLLPLAEVSPLESIAAISSVLSDTAEASIDPRRPLGTEAISETKAI